MTLPPPRSQPSDTLLPYTALFRSLARAATGSFLLQTEAGQLLLQTAVPLPPGAGLALQVLQGGMRPQVLILPGPSAAGGATGGAPTAVAPGSIADVTYLTPGRSEEHTSELQSLMRISYAVFCLKK